MCGCGGVGLESKSKAGGFQDLGIKVCLGFRVSGFRVYLDPR